MELIALLVFLIALIRIRKTLSSIKSMQLRSIFMFIHFLIALFYVVSLILFLYFIYREHDYNLETVDSCVEVNESAIFKIKREREKIFYTDPIETILNLFVLFLIQNFAREIKSNSHGSTDFVFDT